MKQVPAHPNNYGIGRAGHQVDKIILHWIAGTLASCDKTFQDPNRKASAHYGVGGKSIHQYVDESNTAWHAGNLTVNRQSIGIENEGSPTIPISEDTYKTSAMLVKDICQRYNIPLNRTHIKGHNEISATQCPGTLDIDKLIRLAQIEDMTEQEKNILNFLKEQKADEGKVREAFGCLQDMPQKNEQIQTLSAKVIDLDLFTKDLLVRIETLEGEIKANNDLVTSWQSEVKTANKQIKKISEELETMTQQKNKYKNYYEKALDKSAGKLSTIELFKLFIKKLFKK
jgi:N-acetylmuramoyl-L-alanine amidase CwlA